MLALSVRLAKNGTTVEMATIETTRRHDHRSRRRCIRVACQNSCMVERFILLFFAIVSIVLESGWETLFFDEAAGLPGPKFGVSTTTVKQLAVRTGFDDTTVVKYDDAIHFLNGTETMCVGDGGAALHKF